MSRLTLGAVALSVASLAAAAYLYGDNRRLERALAARGDATAAAATTATGDPWAPRAAAADGPDRAGPSAGSLGGRLDRGDAPELQDAPKESRLQRRVRRQQELAAMLGRLDGETEQEYRDRLLPMMELGLAGPRASLAEQRAQVEAAAGVTEDQRRQLDAAFSEVYEEVLAFTNSAVQDGQLSPYERNVAGLLEYAGGLGTILGSVEGRIGGILSPQQLRSIYDSGFEWAEYLGVSAPWERLTPPPPPPGGS